MKYSRFAVVAVVLILISATSFLAYQTTPIKESAPVPVVANLEIKEVKEIPQEVVQEVAVAQAVKQPPVVADPIPQPEPEVVPEKPVVKKQEKLFLPNSSIEYALGDVLTVTEFSTDPKSYKLRNHIRYLSLYNQPEALRRDYLNSVSFVVNSLSRRAKITTPVFVGASQETLIRINLKDYGISPDAWDELVRKGSGPRPYPEPYFHAVVVELVSKPVTKTKKVPTGKTYNDGTPEYKEEVVKAVEKTAGTLVSKRAPWLDPKMLDALERETCTFAPVVRADWFIVNAILPPAYYNLLGLGKSLDDFEALVGSDRKKSAEKKSQDRAVVLDSTVARNNRTLTRSPITGSRFGYHWQSEDTAKSTLGRDYAKNPLDAEFDATEDIASLPNGLQVYFLTDGKRNRLDQADNNVATDSTARDKVVRTGRSCMICHADGIRPIVDEIRTLTVWFSNRTESIKLVGDDEKNLERGEDLFGSNLVQTIARDQQTYANAVGVATGLTPAKNASQLAIFYDNYAEELLTKEQISRDIGCTTQELEMYIRGIEVNVPSVGKTRIASNDNVILGLTKEPVRPVRRDQWEQGFQGFMGVVLAIRAQDVILNAPPPPEVKDSENPKPEAKDEN